MYKFGQKIKNHSTLSLRCGFQWIGSRFGTNLSAHPVHVLLLLVYFVQLPVEEDIDLDDVFLDEDENMKTELW